MHIIIVFKMLLEWFRTWVTVN